MNNNNLLRDKADENRTRFFKGVVNLQQDIRPLRLLDNALAAADPDFEALARMTEIVKRNPFGVVAILAGVWLFMHQLTLPKSKKTETRRAVRQSSRSRSIQKGGHHGYNYRSEFE